ncbi:unnamed protein product [Caenorhabditis auriculariae]|uniref:Costars domain-containing protein n=1 Tax=Caenorhabditis auriculariae TaxID=2777116 RepID=A0A8S1GNT8_9PELO|nr:unnamed protein product [Caenorhabditis auriculariae]
MNFNVWEEISTNTENKPIRPFISHFVSQLGSLDYPQLLVMAACSSASGVGQAIFKFRAMEHQEAVASADDVYAKGYTPKKTQKNSAEYGTPKPGTLTEARAKKAASHVAREMLYLCEIIEDYGDRSNPEKVNITFGKLFGVYEHISDKVVGILLRARKHGMVDFEGEMLFQRRDDHVVISLLLHGDKLKAAIISHREANPSS